MVTRQFDAITLTFLSVRDIDTSQALNNVLDILKLGELWDNFEYYGRDKWYPYIYRYNDISVCVCREDKLHKQGICVRMSGNGLAFYLNFLDGKGIKFRNVCRAWRASAVNGDFTRCTRIDYAVDDIHKNDETPLLTMHKVRLCVKKREFRSRLLAERPVSQQYIEISDSFSKRGDENCGDTFYFGNRKSTLFCRFYDKRLEQVNHNQAIEDDITSWVRCEFEFHDARAMAVFNDFCDLDEGAFSDKMCEVFNNYICFINKDDCNRSRCSVKRWWREFLGTAKRSRLTMPPYRPRSFKGNSEYFQNIAPSMYVYICTVGLRYFLDMIVKYGKKRVSAKHRQVQNDFIHEFSKNNDKINDMDENAKNCANLGLDYWLMTNGRDKKAAMKSIQEDYKRFRTVNGLEWKEYSAKPDKGVQARLAEAFNPYERDEWYEAFCCGV